MHASESPPPPALPLLRAPATRPAPAPSPSVPLFRSGQTSWLSPRGPLTRPAPAPSPPQVRADIMAAAESPLESALASRLNDVLWDVERRSMDEDSMEE